MKFAPLFVISFLTMVLIMGFVVDGGGKTQTLQQATTIAQSAARAGTNAATGSSISGDAFDLSPRMAAAAARSYLATAGVTGTVRVNGDVVTVTVEMKYSPRILEMVGDLTVHATGSARLIGN